VSLTPGTRPLLLLAPSPFSGEQSVVNLKTAFAAQQKWAIVAEMVLGVVLIGIVDLMVDWEKSLFVFYGNPIFIVGWWVGRRAAFGIALLAAAAWFLANLHDSPYSTSGGYAWATATRLCYLGFVAAGTSAMRSESEQGRARLAALTEAREHELEVVRAVERERIRIGQDLHDGVCQNLAAIGCATACLREALEGGHADESALAGKIQAYLQQTTLEARNLARGIVPVQVERDGMISALKELVSRANFARDGSAYFESSGDVQIEDQQVALHLYRIAQEAMSNAARHAHATQVAVTLSADDAEVTLAISDDGDGFDPDSHAHQGMGLRTMQYRATLIGARLEVVSEAGHGTTVRCIVPCVVPVSSSMASPCA
jgi:signal transduction histidine kinase